MTPVCEAHAAFREFVLGPEFSCLAGKSAIRRGTYRVGAYARLDDADVTAGLARDLYAFTRERREFNSDYTCFAAFFEREGRPTPGVEPDEAEGAFERQLWSQLQRLHELDAQFHRWDPSVSSDPANPHFSFSVGGCAFFIVGLHPAASRSSRRFPWPTLVFNAHEQFDHLKASGTFAGLQKQIRAHELSLDGSLNANLADFGAVSEARQYSGRQVDAEWQCPFRSVR